MSEEGITEGENKYSAIYPFTTYQMHDGKLVPRSCYVRLGIGRNAMGTEDTIFLEMGEDDCLGTTVLAIQLDGSLVRYGGCNSSYLQTDIYGRIICRHPLEVRREIDA